MLDINLLKTFLSVAAGLSFRKAASELHYAPSTVTAQVKSLEQTVGAALFIRSGRRVELTDRGRRLLDYARRIVDLENEARRLVSGDDAEDLELAVRMSESLGIHYLPRLLAGFRERFPRIRLTVATHSRNGLVRDLHYGIMDLALFMGESFADPIVVVEELCRIPLSVVVPATSPLAGSGRVEPFDLAGLPLIVTPRVWNSRQAIERAFADDGVEPGSVTQCDNMEIVKSCILEGQGVSVLPDFTVAEEVRLGRLACLEWGRGPLDVPLLLVRAAERRSVASIEAFIQVARGIFSKDDV